MTRRSPSLERPTPSSITSGRIIGATAALAFAAMFAPECDDDTQEAAPTHVEAAEVADTPVDERREETHQRVGNTTSDSPYKWPETPEEFRSLSSEQQDEVHQKVLDHAGQTIVANIGTHPLITEAEYNPEGWITFKFSGVQVITPFDIYTDTTGIPLVEDIDNRPAPYIKQLDLVRVTAPNGKQVAITGERLLKTETGYLIPEYIKRLVQEAELTVNAYYPNLHKK